MSQESCHHLNSQIEKGYWNMLRLHSSFCVYCDFHCNLPNSLIRHICYSWQPLLSSLGALFLGHTLWFRLYASFRRYCFGFKRNIRFSKFGRTHFGSCYLLGDFHICHGEYLSKLSQVHLGCQYQSLKGYLPEPLSSSSRCWIGQRWHQQRMNPVLSSWHFVDV